MSNSDELNPAIRNYIVLLACAAMTIFIVSMAFGRPDYSGEQALYAVLLGTAILVAQCFPIHLTDKTKVNVDSVFLIAAALLLPPLLAMATAALATAIYEFAQHISREQAIFNIAQTALYVAAGSWVFHALSDAGSPPNLMTPRNALAAVACVVLIHLLNTMAVTVVTALQLGTHPVELWFESIRIDLPEQVALFVIGLLLVIVTRAYPLLIPLLLGPLVLIYFSLRRSAELRYTSRALVEAVADLNDLLGQESPGHSLRVAERTRQIAERLGLPAGDTDVAIRAARLHGIGVVGGNGEARANGHAGNTDRAARLVAVLPNHASVATAVRHQRERWDGAGEPDGLHGESIPLPARLVAVADAFERLTSPGDRQSGLSRSRATEVLTSGAGQQWDPRVVNALTEVIHIEAALSA